LEIFKDLLNPSKHFEFFHIGELQHSSDGRDNALLYAGVEFELHTPHLFILKSGFKLIGYLTTKILESK